MAECKEESEGLTSENKKSQPRKEDKSTERAEKQQEKAHKFNDWAII